MRWKNMAIGKVRDDQKNPTTLTALGEAVRTAKGTMKTKQFVAEMGLTGKTGLKENSVIIMVGQLIRASEIRGAPECSFPTAKVVCEIIGVVMPEDLWGRRARVEKVNVNPDSSPALILAREKLEKERVRIAGVERWLETRSNEISARNAQLDARETELDAREAMLEVQKQARTTVLSSGEKVAGVEVNIELLKMIQAAAAGIGWGSAQPRLTDEIKGEFRRELLAYRTAELQRGNCHHENGNHTTLPRSIEIGQLISYYECLRRSLKHHFNSHVGKVSELASVRYASNLDMVGRIRDEFNLEIGRMTDWVRLTVELGIGDEAAQDSAAKRLAQYAVHKP